MKVQTARFDDVADFINGRAFKPSEWGDKGIPIIRIQNLTGTNEAYNFFDGKVDEHHLVRRDDLLISWSASLGVYRWKGANAALNQHIFKVQLRDNIDSQYFYYAAQHSLTEMASMVHGSTMQHITKDRFDSLPILLPPLPEQRRIATQLEEADRLRRTRRYTLELSDSFLPATFRQLFGERFISGSFQRLGDLVTITGGGTPARENPDFYTGSIPWFTSKDMRGEYIWDTEEHITEEGIRKSATKLVPEGSVLLVVKSKVLMHRLPVAISKVALCHGQDIKSIQCSDELNNEIARYALRFHEPRLLRLARGANTEGLTLPMIEELPMPKISAKEQQHFATLVTQHERLRATQRESLRQAEHLFQTLLHRAFATP